MNTLCPLEKLQNYCEQHMPRKCKQILVSQLKKMYLCGQFPPPVNILLLQDVPSFTQHYLLCLTCCEKPISGPQLQRLEVLKLIFKLCFFQIHLVLHCFNLTGMINWSLHGFWFNFGDERIQHTKFLIRIQECLFLPLLRSSKNISWCFTNHLRYRMIFCPFDYRRIIWIIFKNNFWINFFSLWIITIISNLLNLPW